MSKLNIDEIELKCISGNTSKNFHRVVLGKLVLFFSYETVVAFMTPQTGLCVSENIWGTTTGRHLNLISEKKDRLPRQEFLDKINNIIIDVNTIEGNE